MMIVVYNLDRCNCSGDFNSLLVFFNIFWYIFQNGHRLFFVIVSKNVIYSSGAEMCEI